jgi:hypothetical protein
MGSCYRLGKKAHTKIESSSQDELRNDLSANTKQRFQARSSGFFGREKVKRESCPLSTYLAHDAANAIFKEMVAGDTTLRSILARTSQLTRGLAFLVHSFDTYRTPFSMFKYGATDVTEWNKLTLGGSRLRACLKNVSKGYTRGAFFEKMPLYVLETDLLAACACAKTIQSWRPNDPVAIVIVDVTSLERDGTLVSAAHAYMTLRLSSPADLLDKVLVWAEDWKIGTAETFRPLDESVITVIDWRRLQLSRVGLEWFKQLRRSPEMPNTLTCTQVHQRWLDHPQQFRNASLPVTEMFVELWIQLGMNLNANATQQLARMIVIWSAGFLSPDEQDDFQIMRSAGEVDEAIAQLLSLQADKYAGTRCDEREVGRLQMHIVEELYADWKDQQRQSHDTSAVVKRHMSTIDEAWHFVKRTLAEHQRAPVVPVLQDTQSGEETQEGNELSIFHDPRASPRVDSVAPKSSASDLRSFYKDGEEEIAGWDLTSEVSNDTEEEPICAVAMEGSVIRPLVSHSVSRDSPTRLGSRVPGAFK